MSRAAPRRNTGFTLIEVLVALSISAVIAAAVYMSLHAAYRARRSMSLEDDAMRSARVAMAQIGRDLTSTLPPTGILAGSFIGSSATGSMSRDADTVTFFDAADAGRETAGRGDVQQITFAFVDDPSIVTNTDEGDRARRVIVRRTVTNLLSTVAATPEERVLCRGVSGFNLRYYDGTGWAESWDSTTNDNLLPLAVEVTLLFDRVTDRNGSTESARLTRVFPIPAGRTAQTASTATPSGTPSP